MNFLDKAIAVVSPQAALARTQARIALRRYEAATKGRRTDGMLGGGSSINQEILRDGKNLRDGARFLEQNNGYAKKAFRTFKLNVVGTGIRPAIKGKGTKVKTAKLLWNSWADSLNCDFEGHQTFYGLQALSVYNVAMSGEVLVLRRRNASLEIPLQLQVVEPEYLDQTKDKDKTDGGGWISQGIEFDANGRRTGYHIYDRHPAETTKVESRFIPASEVIHLYLKERPGQQRGIPFIHASILQLKDFEDYRDAQLMKQKVSACFTAFVQASDSATGSEDMQNIYGRIEPGRIQQLNPGETVQFGTPPSTEGFGDYSRATLQGISAGVGVSYEVLTNDYSNVNFSSGRMGWIEFQRLVEDLQENLIIPVFCAQVWRWFTEALVLRKGSSYSGLEMSWTSPRREMIDPVKETKAILEQVKGGLLTWSEAVRQMGYDPDEVAEAYAADLELFDRLGMKVSSDFRNELLRYSKGNEAASESVATDSKK